MSASKRDRENARRRYDKYLERQRVAKEKQRRNQRIGYSVLAGILTVALGISVFLMTRPDAGTSDPSADPSSSQDPTSTDTATGSDLTALGTPAKEGSPCDPATAEFITQPAKTWESAPSPDGAEGRDWEAKIATNCGQVNVNLEGAKAPQAVSSFLFLSKEGFFDKTLCHRLTTSGIHVLQCGDPTALGTGSPGYHFGPIENAPPATEQGMATYPAGTIAMANSGSADSNGSQFFIVYEDSQLPPSYTVLGQVTEGLDIVKSIAAGGSRTGSDGAPNWPIVIQGVNIQ